MTEVEAAEDDVRVSTCERDYRNTFVFHLPAQGLV